MSDWHYSVFEFTDELGRSVIGRWLEDAKITKRDRAALVAKMDMLAMAGPDLSGGLLAGPIAPKRKRKAERHIYKLVVHGSVMLRPMLCKGPFDNENEFTMLLGAIETGGVLDHDPEEAEDNRQALIAMPWRRVRNGRYR